MTGEISPEELAEFKATGFITTHLALQANLYRAYRDSRGQEIPEGYGELVGVLESIYDAVDEFNVEVWLKWLYGRQAFEEHMFLESASESVRLLVGSSAGRVMVTLRWNNGVPEEQHHYISIIGADKLSLTGSTDPKAVLGLCGFQGIGMNGDGAVKLLREACRLTKSLYENTHPCKRPLVFG